MSVFMILYGKGGFVVVRFRNLLPRDLFPEEIMNVERERMETAPSAERLNTGHHVLCVTGDL